MLFKVIYTTYFWHIWSGRTKVKWSDCAMIVSYTVAPLQLEILCSALRYSISALAHDCAASRFTWHIKASSKSTDQMPHLILEEWFSLCSVVCSSRESLQQTSHQNAFSTSTHWLKCFLSVWHNHDLPRLTQYIHVELLLTSYEFDKETFRRFTKQYWCFFGMLETIVNIEVNIGLPFGRLSKRFNCDTPELKLDTCQNIAPFPYIWRWIGIGIELGQELITAVPIYSNIAHHNVAAIDVVMFIYS